MSKMQYEKQEISTIANALNMPDGIVAFPTDTVWGIGCLVEHPKAVERIYSLKGRSKEKPLILLSSKIEYLKPYVQNISPKAMQIVNEFLPGAVTLVLPKSSLTPDYITSGFDTVGIRIPDCQLFAQIVESCTKTKILATTSANVSGETSLDNKKDVFDAIGATIDYVPNDFGFKPSGIDSTVMLIDKNDNIKILRQGAIKLQ